MDDSFPALGYSNDQRQDFARMIERTGADIVVVASPCRLDRLLELSLPMVRVRHRFVQLCGKPIVDIVLSLLAARGQELASE